MKYLILLILFQISLGLRADESSGPWIESYRTNIASVGFYKSKAAEFYKDGGEGDLQWYLIGKDLDMPPERFEASSSSGEYIVVCFKNPEVREYQGGLLVTTYEILLLENDFVTIQMKGANRQNHSKKMRFKDLFQPFVKKIHTFPDK